MKTPVGDPGIESRVLLARARSRLLGKEPEQPLKIGRYEVIDRVGAGGMGIVYAARDLDLDRKVAIKVLRSTLDRDAYGRSRLVREAQALAKLSHPNVVVVYEVGRHDGQVFVSMEFVEGRTLRQWISEEKPSAAEILRMFVEAGRGLLAAHRAGVVHRDFKPDNVIVGGDGRPRVMDFGLARPSLDTDAMVSQESASGDEWDMPTDENLIDVPMTATGTVMGTPAYMDPDQLLGASADRYSDQYAYCVSLFEAFYGERPYQGSSMTELARHMGTRTPVEVDVRGRGVSKAVHRALMQGLAFERSQRHGSFAELLSLLENATRASKRRRAAPWIAGLASVGLAAAAVTHAGPSDSEALPQPEVSQPAESPWTDVVAQTDLPDEIPHSLPGDPVGLTIHRLENGLTVYVVPRSDQPKISVRVVVRAGPADEPQGAAGVAELTREMLRAGGPRVGVMDPESEAPLLARQHEALLAMPQAQTEAERNALARQADEAFHLSAPFLATGDEGWLSGHFGAGARMEEGEVSTQWWNDVPSSRLEAWVALQAELMRNPSFRGMTAAAAEWLDTQRWVYQGGAPYMAMGRLFARAYGQARDPAAEFASVSRLPLAEVMSFHDTYYRPNNVALVLIGDISPERAVSVIEDAFGDWEPAPIPDPPLLRDEPWGSVRQAMELSLPTTPEAWVGWTLPPPHDGTRSQIEAFASLLSGPHGIVRQELADSEFVTDSSVMLYDRGLVLMATPVEGATVEQAEKELADLMQRIADGAIDREVWSHALDRLPIDASHWSRNDESLSHMIAESYVHHRPWTEVASSLRPVAPSRAEVSKLAGELIERGQATLYLKPGPPWTPGTESLPFNSVASRFESDNHSAFALQLLDIPASDVEPRFLSDGMHFERHTWGDAEVLTAPQDGPLFRMSLVYPMGVWHDPFVCDAVHARLRKWRADVGAFAGADVAVSCGVEETTFEVTGVTEDFPVVWAETWARLGDTELPDAVVEDHLSTALRWRVDARHSADHLQEALGTYASLGERSLDRNLPSDVALRRATPERLRQSLSRLSHLTPDVLYAGTDPDGVIDRLPEPPGVGEAPPEVRPVRPRTMLDDVPTVYVLDRPGVDQADARLYIRWPADEPNAEVLSNLYMLHAAPGFEVGKRTQVVVYAPQAMLDDDPGRRLEHGWAYSAGHDNVVEILEAAIDDLHRGPAASGFEQAQDDLESRYRVERMTGISVAVFARNWTGDIDPRLRRWTQLRRIDQPRFAEFGQKVAGRPPVLTVVGDVSRIDMDGLRKLGRVRRVKPEEILRDVHLTDSGWAGL